MTIQFNDPIVTRIKTSHRDDGSPKASCQLLSPIRWVDGGLVFTFSPWLNDQGEIVNTVQVTPVNMPDQDSSVNAHFKTKAAPKPKKPVKAKPDLNVGG